MTKKLEELIEEIKADDKRVRKVVKLITQYGGTEGEHHKQWLLDQTLRTLLGPNYQSWRDAYEESYSEWDRGISP